jgi:hypothetical protein
MDNGFQCFLDYQILRKNRSVHAKVDLVPKA